MTSPMGAFGADVSDLEQLRAALHEVGIEARNAVDVVDALLDGVLWTGPDSTAFRTEWSGSIRSGVIAASTVLTDAAVAIGQQRDQQVEASTGSTAGLGAPGGSPFGGWPAGDLPQTSASEATDIRTDRARDALEDALAGNPDGLDVDEALEGLENASDEELMLIDDLRNHGLTDAQLVDFLKGAHVRIEDPSLFDKWADLGGEDRASSHYPDDPHRAVGIRGSLVKEALIGKVGGFTYIQLERHPATEEEGGWTGAARGAAKGAVGGGLLFGPAGAVAGGIGGGAVGSTGYGANDAAHGGDYVIHKATGKQVGPYGLSPTMDDDPIILPGRTS